MNAQEYLNNMRNIQENLLNFLNTEFEIEEPFQNLNNLFNEQKIFDDQYKVKTFLNLLVLVANNYHHESKFYDKIDKILEIFEASIKKYFSNDEIYQIFKSNKRILLFLIKKKLFTFNKNIVQELVNFYRYKNSDFFEYFKPEIQQYKDCIQYPLKIDFQEKLPENFEELRKQGENDSIICELIRNNSIKEFIVHINKNNISVDSQIPRSIYETNSFLIDEHPTLIEYAAFYGAIHIFNYLLSNEVKLTKSLYLYSIHGQNAEIIHILEDNKIEKDNEECLEESIKCYHNDIENYIVTNYLENDESYISALVFHFALTYYNYALMEDEKIDQCTFFDFCDYNHFIFALFKLKNTNVDTNEITISSLIYLTQFLTVVFLCNLNNNMF